MSPGPGWRKSSYSEAGNCIEVATAGTVRVRDSKDPDGPQLTFSPAEWDRFTSVLKLS
jgi:hypothetical protein